MRNRQSAKKKEIRVRGNDFMELRAFELVARNSSFSRASEELGVSRAALSQSVKALEQRLGVQLLSRTTRSVSLTDAGRELLGRLSPALLDLVSAVDNIDRFREQPAGYVRVASDRSGINLFLDPVATDFAAAYPEITLEIAMDDGRQDFIAHGYDAAIRQEDHIPQDMVAVALGKAKRRILVAAPQYFDKRQALSRADELHGHNCIMVRNGLATHLPRWHIFQGDQAIIVDVQPTIVVSDEAMAIDASAKGAGIGLVIEDLVKERIDRGEFVRVLEGSFSAGPSYNLCYPKHRFPKISFKAFVDFIREKTAFLG